MNLNLFSQAKRKTLVALCAALCLAACASSGSAVQHYMLPQAESTPSVAVDTAQALLLAPIRLSALVDRRGLLLQTNDIQVQEARQHQWAEDLAQQLLRRLRGQLAANLTQWKVASLGSLSVPGYRLILQIDQFHGRYDGRAVVSGHWQLLDEDRREVIAKSFLLTEVLQEDGYPELVRSLDRAWQALATQIAQAIQSMPE